MELAEFVAQVAGFDALSPRDKIRLFAWHLHAHRDVETFDNAGIRDCFGQIGMAAPDVSVYLPRMAERKPADLVRVRGGYQLEWSVRKALDAKYGANPTTVAVTRLLADLPAKLPDAAERSFLAEALACYRVKAFRAAITMTWNLAFDHMLRWILADTKRIADFNAAIAINYPKRRGFSVSQIDDFEEFTERETIEVCRTANLYSKNVTEILREKLKRRNIAAHPSQIVVTQPQADDVITDLVNNVVLKLR